MLSIVATDSGQQAQLSLFFVLLSAQNDIGFSIVNGLIHLAPISNGKGIAYHQSNSFHFY